MYTIHQPHPSPDLLAAYDQAMLSPEVKLDVEAHLRDCAVCCQLLEARLDPGFVAKVRLAGKVSPAEWDASWTPRPEDELDFPSTAPPLTSGEWPATEWPDPNQPPLECHVLWRMLANHPRYRLKSVLGEGGMGVVFLAEHLLMGRDVALKAIKSAMQLDEVVLARFRREVKANAQLSHPNLVRAYDAEQVDSVWFFVMEHLDGEDLGKTIAREGPLPVTRACQLAMQAALGLQHAHEKGMVHRDVKPQNMLVTKDGTLKLLDFGLARVLAEARQGTALTHVQGFMGTPDYVAPEQAVSPVTTDIRADVYSLGCTLYHLLTGQPPFAGCSVREKLERHLVRTPKALREVRKDVPAELEAVVRRMMAKDPAERYQTPGEVAKALGVFCREKKERRWAMWWKAVAAAVVLVGGVVYSIKTDKGELVLETLDPDVEVEIKQNGRIVTIMDGKTKKKVTLRDGVYTAELKDEPGFEIEAGEFTLKSGGREIVRVKRKQNVPVWTGPIVSPLKKSFGQAMVTGEMKGNANTFDVAMDAKGQFVVVWRRFEGKIGDVYVRMFSSTGKPSGPAFQVSGTTGGDHIDPVVAMAPDGGFLVAWGGEGSKGRGVYARRYSTAGKPMGEEFLVNTILLGRGAQPKGIAFGAKGDFVVLYSPGIAGDRYHAYVQRFDATGKKVGEEVLVDRRTHVNGGTSRLALAADNRFAVAWSTGNDVVVQGFKPDGTRDGEEFIVNTPLSTGIVVIGSLAFDRRGQLTVVWAADLPRNSGRRVFLRRCDAEWRLLGGEETQVTNCGPSDGGMALSGRGQSDGVLVCTTGYIRTRVARALYFDANGQPQGEAFPIGEPHDGDECDPRIAVNDRGQAVVVWLASPPARDQSHVFMRGFQIGDRTR